MSLITSGLVGSNWPGAAKSLVVFLLCLIGAFVPIAVADVDLTNLVLVLPLMWVGSQVFYRAWFKPYGIAPWIETLFLNSKSEPVAVRRYEGRYDAPSHYDDILP